MAEEVQQISHTARLKEACFTSFKTVGIDWWQDWTVRDKSIKYTIVQGELTKDGREHIQGYVQFKKQLSVKQIKQLFGDKGMHVERRMAPNYLSAIEYCKQEKNGRFHDFVEFGDHTNSQGKRTDLIGIRNKIRDGQKVTEIIHNTESGKELNHILTFNKAFKSYEEFVDDKKSRDEVLKEYEGVVWKKWQQDLIDEIALPYEQQDKRKVIWVYDEIGNQGKSYLAIYLVLMTNAYYITGGKQADILYGYQNQNVVVYDLARTYSDNVSHIMTTVENFKSGSFLSTKYVTRLRVFKKPVCVIFANFLPDLSALSKDRWDIRDVTERKSESDD